MPKSRKSKSAPRRASKKKGTELTPPDIGHIFEPIPVDTVVRDERKRPRLLAILFCDFANITDDGKANLIGIFDSIKVDKATKTTPRFFVFIRVAEIEDGFLTTVFNGDDRPVLQFRSLVQVEEFSRGLPRQAQTMIALQISKIEKEGTFWFDVSFNGNSIGGAGLPVHYISEGGQDIGTGTYI